MSPQSAAPLAVAVPLVAGALRIFLDRWAPQRLAEALAIAAAAFSTVACSIVTAAATHGTVVHWFGGWRPRGGISLGIDFAVDPVGGALATFVALLTTAALVYTWTYYEEGGPPFAALMLVFEAALVGFFLTGDLFNLFVWFELMSVSAYALTAYRTEDESALMGAIAFAVVNSVGAFLILIGIALVYGRSGALNMAQIAHALGSRADALAVVALAFIVIGFLVKAAIVPFHFWLADAHAVAPTPLCVLFSGIMVQAGLYAAARVYWSVFSGVLPPHGGALRAVLLAFGVLTAAVGAIMCFRQRHFKRLLALSTVTHSGILLCALALLSARALGGAWLYIIGHGFVKGALFMCSGILLNRLGSLDVEELRGKLRTRRWVTALIALGALGLAGLPPFGTFLGKSLIDDAANEAAAGWLPYALLVAAAFTGGAVLRALGTMAFAWGPPPDSSTHTPSKETPETTGDDRGMPAVMLTTASVLLACGLGAGAVRGASAASLAAAARFVDRPLQLAVVLSGAPSGPLAMPPSPSTESGIVLGGASALLALAVAALALFGYRARGAWDRTEALTARLFGWLHALHSGLVTDYVAWLAAGTAAFGLTLVALTSLSR
jgi:multicomponent Na+:H+ antiporter subunit D